MAIRLNRGITIVALLALATVAPAAAPPGSHLDGKWDATVTVNGLDIPFPFEIATKDGAPVASFFNGDRRITSTASRPRDGGVILAFAQYGTTLDLSVEPGRLTGEYRRGTRTIYPFRATRAVSAPPAMAGSAPAGIAGTWIVPAKSSKGEKAWRFVARQDGSLVTASILRVDGDTGTLTGTFRDGRYVLSHFSGARPMLLEVAPQADGTLKLRQNGRTEIVAVREEDPRAGEIGTPTDPELHTTVADASEPFRFSFPDLGGRIVSNTDAQFAGKVVLVNISGSWCPNCHDEAPFLALLYDRYHRRGLEIVTLSFEEQEQLADPVRLRAFIDSYRLKHTFLLAGVPDQLNEKVPQAVNLNAFPTTFILGRDGRVRRVHAGFPGPGSGAFYRQAQHELSSQIERLLDEPQRPRADVTAVPLPADVTPGSSAKLTLRVHLPGGIHVQSDKPRDPSLIATALALTLPAGVTLDRIVFPQATEFAQVGQARPLLVFGGDFSVDAYLAVSSEAAAGEAIIPAALRYQACNDRVCFPPARATAEWTLTIRDK